MADHPLKNYHSRGPVPQGRVSLEQEGGCLKGSRFLPNLNFSVQSDPDFSFQSRSGFRFQIVITIAIEKPIRINRDPVFIFKSDPDFFVSIVIRFFLFKRTLIEKWFL
jgi:hypothetical protein